MMTVIFAVNRQDAEDYCKARGLVFEDVVWVLNDQLLGDVVESEVVPHYTGTFREMPAYAAALGRFGESPAG